MGIVDEVLFDLRNGLPWAEICRKYRSKSQLYEAYRILSDEMGDNLLRRRDDLAKVQLALREAETCRDQVIEEKKLVTNDVAELKAEKQRLKNYVSNKRKKVAKLEERVSDLERRGYTPEIVKEIANVEKRSPKKLLCQIRTAEDCVKLTRKVERLENEKISLEDNNQIKQKVKESLQYEIHILEQQFDELQVRSMTYSDAVSTTEDFLEEGYSDEDLKSLRYSLRTLQTKGEPRVSIKALLDRLRKTKSLYRLETEIKKRKIKLVEIQSEVEIFAAKRDAIKDGIIGQLDKAADYYEQKIQESGQLTKNAIEEASKEYSCFLDEQKNAVQEFTQSLKKDIADYGNLKEMVGTLKENVIYGHAFWGFANVDEYLCSLKPSVIAAILRRIAFWTKLHFRERLTPCQKMAMESGISQFSSYNVSALLEGIAEAVRSKVNSKGDSV